MECEWINDKYFADIKFEVSLSEQSTFHFRQEKDAYYNI